MTKQIIYLELSQGNESNRFHTLLEYEYGTGKEFKTLTKAMNKATKDFEKQSIFHLKNSLKWIGTRTALRITSPFNEGIMIHNEIEISN